MKYAIAVRASVVLAGLLPFIASASAQSGADDFFRGKTITMATHTAPGGAYDAYLRLLARHISRHIPGNPNMLVVNQPGAGGLLSLNYAARRAPQDGTSESAASVANATTVPLSVVAAAGPSSISRT